MRSFIALEIDSNAKKDFSSFKEYVLENRISDKLKVVEEKNLHLTLFFIGDRLNREDILKLADEIKHVSFRKIDFYISKLGFFKDELNPRVIWLMPDSVACERIKDVYCVVKEILKKYDIDEEEDFFPHITLARTKRPLLKDEVDILKQFKVNGRYAFLSLVLFESNLTPSGPIYTKIGEVIG